jgi:hypothetical protein
MRNRYYLRLPNAKLARGSDPTLAFRSESAEGLAEELQSALSTTELFERWKQRQPEPDDIDDSLAIVDPQAQVTGEQIDLHVDLIATTSLPGSVFKHRLRLLAGSHWQLRDVTAG